MRRAILLLIIAAIGMMAVGEADARQKRTSRDVRRERQRTEKQIENARRRLRQNDDETRRQLNRLGLLEADIRLKNDTIARLSARLDSLDADISRMDDSIAILAKRSAALKAAYARALRDIRTRRQGMSDMAFIFSAESFGQAWRRLRYLRQTARYNDTRARQVHEAADYLTQARAEADSLRRDRAADLSRIETSRSQLSTRRAAADALVSNLRRKGSSLNRELKRRREQAAALDRELDRVIEREIREAEERRRREEEAARRKAEAEARARAEAEARAKAAAKPGAGTKPTPDAATTPKPATAPKPAATPKPAYTSSAEADRRLTGSFAANKGRLLFPVAGRYTITSNFGTNTHPGLSRVKIDNLGIDIEVPAGTGARAVFDGTVSSIFRLDGFHNIVILRHGEYLSVYGGLGSLAVKKGDKVKTGQTLGAIHVDRTDDDRTRLHFEIRREKQKLNPVEWVR